MTINRKTASALLIVATALTAFCSAQGGGRFGGDQRRVIIQEDGSNISRVFQVHSKLDGFAKTWADGDKDERAQLAEKAMVVLNEEFDSDFKAREKSVEQLEKRLSKLKQQLDRRASKKDEIVKLRLQQLTMSWEGLGWNDRGPHGLSVAPPAPPARPAFPARVANLSEVNPFGSHDHEGNLAAYLEQAHRKVRWKNEVADVEVKFNEDGHDVDLDLDEIRNAAEEKVEQIVRTYLDNVRELDSHNANEALWELATEEDLEISEELWLEAAKIAEKVAGKIKVTRSPSGKANTLDTAAHLYHNGGDLDKAIKLQELAVELNPDNQLEEFLRALRFTKKEATLELEE